MLKYLIVSTLCLVPAAAQPVFTDVFPPESLLAAPV